MGNADDPGHGAHGAGPHRDTMRLRAAFAADIANYTALVSVEETKTIDALSILRRVAKEELKVHGGWLFGLPGDGIFALFESAVDAVRCALQIQARLAGMPQLSALRLRVGIHLGDVRFRDGLPFGETLVIAARLESLAEPGGILISGSVMDAVAARISATFEEKGMRSLKHSPKLIATFGVSAPPPGMVPEEPTVADPLDATVITALANRPAAAPPRPEPATPPPGPAAPPSVPPAHFGVAGEALVEMAKRPALPEATVIAPLPRASPFVIPDPRPPAPPRPPEPVAVAPAAPPAVEHEQRPVAPTGHPPPPSPVQAGPEPGPGMSEDQLGRIALLLTSHLGPVARIVTRRRAEENRNPERLIQALALEIPRDSERHDFLRKARDVLEGR